MLGKLLPVLLALGGLGAGIGAGVALKPAPAEEEMTETCAPTEDVAAATPPEPEETDSDFAKMTNDFLVPVIREGRVAAMVVMGLSLEIEPGKSDEVMNREPKLRDRFLRVMLDHANSGGFDGAFTSNGAIERLHRALAESARTADPAIRDVLILDINRQDS
ncbi:hypothetical protein SAMN04490244_11820 [Tranquillimonas rosea]|uniref:Flagellar protein FliL n=1 Tax=Tranquillimonas rosea TaxID=641238 RepID=A0A1H9X4K4_9RHOB|nr:hypothetical protein [Tranquillimonas rosea]SES41126.1 hypothetical protein SAMN04490244_11820 [Tranquillimonas rosea]